MEKFIAQQNATALLKFARFERCEHFLSIGPSVYLVIFIALLSFPNAQAQYRHIGQMLLAITLA